MGKNSTQAERERKTYPHSNSEHIQSKLHQKKEKRIPNVLNVKYESQNHSATGKTRRIKVEKECAEEVHIEIADGTNVESITSGECDREPMLKYKCIHKSTRTHQPREKERDSIQYGTTTDRSW